MNISVTVMAHSRRRKQAEELYAKLTTYPFTECTITWDERDNEWHTGERALRWGVSVGADWHIVLQDDAIIPDNFFTHIANAIQHVPARTLISLYTGTARPLGKRVSLAVDKVKSSNFSWIKHYMLLWGVGIIIPTAHIEPMLEFAAGRREPYDTRIGIFYQRNILPVFYCNPSLVDHDDDLGSLLGHGNAPHPRVAHNFISGEPKWNGNFADL